MVILVLSLSFLKLVRKLNDVVPLRLLGLLLIGMLALTLFMHFGMVIAVCDACVKAENGTLTAASSQWLTCPLSQVPNSNSAIAALQSRMTSRQ